jgi:hypothetical protein
VLIALILFIAVLMLIRNGLLGFFMVAFVWLLAGVFDPNIDSGTVWLIGFALGWMLEAEV